MAAPKREFGLGGAAPRWWVVLALLLGLSVFTYARRETGEVEGSSTSFDGSTMGTSYRVVLGEPVSADAGAALVRAIERELGELNREMSTYDPESELSRFNAHASTEPLALSPHLASVLRDALSVSVATNGAFDVTVGPLVDAWGFGPRGRPERIPDEDELRALRARVGYAKLSLEGTRAQKAHPDLAVDLSGIAKGHGVDRLSDLLLARGHEDHLVEIGGELRARGRRPDGAPFRVAIESPVDAARVQAVVALDDRALATSGNYRNHYELAGEEAVHTLDPRSGRPARHALLSASVLHASCALADAWATALMVLGPEEAFAVAKREQLDVLLLVRAADGHLVERETPGFREARLR